MKSLVSLVLIGSLALVSCGQPDHPRHNHHVGCSKGVTAAIAKKAKKEYKTSWQICENLHCTEQVEYLEEANQFHITTFAHVQAESCQATFVVSERFE